MRFHGRFRRRFAAGTAILLASAAVWLGALGSAPRASALVRNVHRIVIDAPITPATSDFITSSIKTAHSAGALALVVELDTPGGLLNSTKTIVKEVMAAPLPVLFYVAPGGAGAISAGVFITMSGHIAAMAPGTTIGAAHPVGGQGEDIQGDMREKVENFAVSFVESIAESRGRNVEWAEKAVRESVAITETEAVEMNVIDFVATDVGDLLAQASGKTVDLAGAEVELDFSAAIASDGSARIVDQEMTFRQQVLAVITDPNIAYLLMMGGMLGLYMEFSNPGVIFPGVAGAICLLLALLASQALPISSTGILLILLGMAFFLAELFLPSFGVLGIGGLVALTLGSLFLYTPESSLVVDRSLITATVAIFATAMGLIMVMLVRVRRRGSVTGLEGLVGEVGVAVTPIDEAGQVKVHGEIWSASSSEPIEQNTRVRVVSVEGLRVVVRPQPKE